jgi:hypothetical protein
MQKLDSQLPVNSEPINNHELVSLIMILCLKNYFIDSKTKVTIEKTFNDLLLNKPISRILENISPDINSHVRIQLIEVLLEYYQVNSKIPKTGLKKKKVSKIEKNDDNVTNLLATLNVLLDSNIVHNFLHINKFEGKTYFNKEHFEELLRWILLLGILDLNGTEPDFNEKIYIQKVKKSTAEINTIINEAELSGYDLNKLKNKVLKVDKTRSSNKAKKKVSKRKETKKVYSRRTKK